MTEEIGKTTTGRTKTKLWLDLLIFIVFLIAMEPHSSGLAVHEWLTLSLLAVLVVHVLLSWDWIMELTLHFLGKMRTMNRLNYILNWLFFIDGTLLMVSGIMISEVALPALGLSLPLGFAWRRLHDMSANLALILLGMHTALHWGWIVKTFNRIILQPITGRLPARGQKESSQ